MKALWTSQSAGWLRIREDRHSLVMDARAQPGVAVLTLCSRPRRPSSLPPALDSHSVLDKPPGVRTFLLNLFHLNPLLRGAGH